MSQNVWLPVATIQEIGSTPMAVRVLGHDIVLWRSGDTLAAFDDRCPHRGAKLSLGRIVGDRLQCGYHGWCFDDDGACRSIPAVPDFVPPSSHAARPWRVAQAHGIVWVAREPLDAAPPALPGVPPRRVMCGPYTVETSAPRVIENFLDTAHFGFVHDGWLGDAAHTEVPRYEVASTDDGRPVIPAYRAWQPRAAASSAAGAWVTYRYEVLGPYAALLVKQPDGGGPADAYAAFANPLDEERTRAWFVQFTTDAATSDTALQRFQDTIFAQDRPVLESQSPKRLPLSGAEVHSAADRLSAAYRRWLLAQGVSYGVC